MAIYAATRGFVDEIKADDVPRFEAELLKSFREDHKDFRAAMEADGVLTEPREAQFRKIINACKERMASRTRLAEVPIPPAEPE
jgi:F-type H+-transporting ATPase subunit alpha